MSGPGGLRGTYGYDKKPPKVSAHRTRQTLDLSQSPTMGGSRHADPGSKDVASWTHKEVIDWLKQNGFLQYVRFFRSRRVTGRDLSSSSAYDLEQRYNVAALHSKKMLRLLKLPGEFHSISPRATSPAQSTSTSSQLREYVVTIPSGQALSIHLSPSSLGSDLSTKIITQLRRSGESYEVEDLILSHKGEELDPDSDLRNTGTGSTVNIRCEYDTAHATVEGSKAILERHPESWNNDDVSIWLKWIGMERYDDSFRKKKVQGRHIMRMSKRKLQTILSVRVLHIRKIMREVRKLTRKWKTKGGKTKGGDEKGGHSRSKSMGANLSRSNSKHRRNKSQSRDRNSPNRKRSVPERQTSRSTRSYSGDRNGAQGIAMPSGDDIAVPDYDFDDPKNDPQAYRMNARSVVSSMRDLKSSMAAFDTFDKSSSQQRTTDTAGATKFCNMCGVKNPSHARFCSGCGKQMASVGGGFKGHQAIINSLGAGPGPPLPSDNLQEEEEEEDGAPENPFMPGTQIEIQGLKGKLTAYNGKKGTLLKKIEEGVWSGLRVWSVQIGKTKCKIKEANLRIANEGGVGFLPRHIINRAHQRSQSMSPSHASKYGHQGANFSVPDFPVMNKGKKKKKSRGHSRSRSQAAGGKQMRVGTFGAI